MAHRRKRNSSKANLILSFIFHSLLVLAVFYFAARQGLMGDKMKSLVATLEQQKPKETPKPKEEPKPEPAKQMEQPKIVAAPTPAPQVQTAAAPAVEARRAAARPARRIRVKALSEMSMTVLRRRGRPCPAALSFPADSPPRATP